MFYFKNSKTSIKRIKNIVWHLATYLICILLLSCENELSENTENPVAEDKATYSTQILKVTSTLENFEHIETSNSHEYRGTGTTDLECNAILDITSDLNAQTKVYALKLLVRKNGYVGLYIQPNVGVYANEQFLPCLLARRIFVMNLTVQKKVSSRWVSTVSNFPWRKSWTVDDQHTNNNQSHAYWLPHDGTYRIIAEVWLNGVGKNIVVEFTHHS